MRDGPGGRGSGRVTCLRNQQTAGVSGTPRSAKPPGIWTDCQWESSKSEANQVGFLMPGSNWSYQCMIKLPYCGPPSFARRSISANWGSYPPREVRGGRLVQG